MVGDSRALAPSSPPPPALKLSPGSAINRLAMADFLESLRLHSLFNILSLKYICYPFKPYTKGLSRTPNAKTPTLLELVHASNATRDYENV